MPQLSRKSSSACDPPQLAYVQQYFEGGQRSSGVSGFPGRQNVAFPHPFRGRTPCRCHQELCTAGRGKGVGGGPSVCEKPGSCRRTPTEPSLLPSTLSPCAISRRSLRFSSMHCSRSEGEHIGNVKHVRQMRVRPRAGERRRNVAECMACQVECKTEYYNTTFARIMAVSTTYLHPHPSCGSHKSCKQCGRSHRHVMQSQLEMAKSMGL